MIYSRPQNKIPDISTVLSTPEQRDGLAMERLFVKLDSLTTAIQALALASVKNTEAIACEWLPAEIFIVKVAIKDSKALCYYMSKGIWDAKAVKNVGTVKRPKYRFHHLLAVDQFLNRKLKVSENSNV